MSDSSGLGRVGRARLGARQHQAVAGEAGPAGAVDAEGRLPDAIDQGRARRIELVAARQRAAAPGGAHQLEIAVHQLVAIVGVEAEGGEGGQVAARPDAHFEAAAGDQVGDGGVLGHAHRQLQRQGDDAGAQPDARGLHRRLGEEHERRRQAAFALVEMMLGDPGRIEAAALGMHDLLGGQPIALGRGGFVEQTGEKAQPLGRRLGHQVNLVGRSRAMQGPACCGPEWHRSARGYSRYRVARRPARSARHRPGGPCACTETVSEICCTTARSCDTNR